MTPSPDDVVDARTWLWLGKDRALCPTCGLAGGFHRDPWHRMVRDRIPRHLIKEKDWQR